VSSSVSRADGAPRFMAKSLHVNQTDSAKLMSSTSGSGLGLHSGRSECVSSPRSPARSRVWEA
jgi:hypothetical protein